MKKTFLPILFLFIILLSCNNEKNKPEINARAKQIKLLIDSTSSILADATTYLESKKLFTQKQTEDILSKCATILTDSAELGLEFATHFHDSVFNITVPELMNEPTIEQTTVPVSNAKWKTIKTWSGSNDKNTEAFLITNTPWRLIWNFTPTDKTNTFDVCSHLTNEEHFDKRLVFLLYEKAKKDTTYIYKSGEYFLEITSTGSKWKVIVQCMEKQ